MTVEAFSQTEQCKGTLKMLVVTMSLDAAWQVTYDSDAKQLLIVGHAGERFSVNEFLSLTTGTCGRAS